VLIASRRAGVLADGSDGGFDDILARILADHG
jgi:hypothetical protein